MSADIYTWLDERRSRAWKAHFAATDAYKAVMDDPTVSSERKLDLAREFDQTRLAAQTIDRLCQEATGDV